uniref:creatininase family protein n=1 Tax=Klebsiella pneumoniae TaxID=573 RepID=UPI0013D572AE
TILFIGDHGPSQAPQARVAAALSLEWARDGVLVAQVDRYYEDREQNRLLEAQGESTATIGFHAGLIDTSELMAVHPPGVMLDR